MDIYVSLLILGNQSLTFHVTSNCYKVFAIYNVPSVLTLMMTLCAEKCATKNWDKVSKAKLSITIK
jgi:hypothetical protein